MSLNLLNFVHKNFIMTLHRFIDKSNVAEIFVNFCMFKMLFIYHYSLFAKL